MSLTDLVADARAAAAGLMQDTCTIHRGGGEAVFNDTTGEYDAAAGTGLYAGPCRVKPQGTTDRVVEAGGQAVSLFPYVVSVPVSGVDFAVDDVVTVTASALDPALVDLQLRVVQPSLGSQLSARRLGCEVVGG